MWEIEDFDDDAHGTVFRDMLMLALVGFVAIVIMLLPHLSEPREADSKEQRSPGSVVVEIHWPDDMRVDVDLWVRAPRDIPVGFYNQTGRLFSLLRDDLGLPDDPSDRNYEVSYSRGIEAGEYLVNVHMYGPLEPGAAVPVKVLVSVRRRHDFLQPVLSTEVKLERYNQEKTAFRFRLDADGNLKRDSVSTLLRRLVTHK